MHVAIIGNGVTGVTAAIRLRRKQPDWRITLISGESKYHYSRPALMYVFMGHMTYQGTKPFEDDFWSINRLDLRRDWVTGIDAARKCLALHRGGDFHFDKLLIATGSKSNRFGWPGQDLKGVQGLYSLQDLRSLYDNANGTRHAVIVGGGLIGIELAEMLHSRNIHVTFLVREPSYWSNILPMEESGMINEIIREQGIGLKLRASLKEILDDGNGRACGVVTEDGERLECQFVGLTAGVSPNIDLVRDSEIETGRGVLVDHGFKTSVQDIYAAGDCAEIVTGGERNLLQQVWYTGRKQGEVAGDVLAGEDRTYDPGIWYNSAKFLDLEYQVYGRVNLNVPGERNLFWRHPAQLQSVRVVYTEAGVIGINLMGIRYRHDVCERWISEQRPVDFVLGHLAEANFDPEVLRQARIRNRTRPQGANVMIDTATLNYDFDEETLGFEEPPAQPAPPASWPERLSIAAVALGFLALVVTLLGPLSGTWAGILLSFGLIAAGSAAYFWFAYRNTVPGIKHDGIMFGSATHLGLIGWGLGIVITGFYVVLYWWPEYLERGVRLVDPLSHALAGGPADRWFFYGFLYTLAILVFGVRMFMKYRHNRYQIIRTASVMFFQLGLAFLIPQLLKSFNQPEFYFTYFWPLKYDYLFPSTVGSLTSHPGALGVFMVFWGAMATFIATPVLTYFYGKRWYCSWVCGCGGLAETLGDPFRQLSSKTTRSWRIERGIIYSVLIFITVTTIALWVNSATEGRVFGRLSGPLASAYGFYIGALFSGVIGVGFYPLMGSRVWCRFGCPMAAILGIFQRFFSRFRITTNGGQCMSCGNCSTYCEMGIDVRAYAQRGENIVRASCVGCGICSAVCPRGVLKLENGPTHADRYPGADQPLAAFQEALSAAKVYEGKNGAGSPDPVDPALQSQRRPLKSQFRRRL